MRRRFFLLIFVFLASTIFLISTALLLFFENERQRLLDQRLETVASSLLASGLSAQLIENLESTEDLIRDLEGDEHIDQIINIWSLSGNILAQNLTGREMPLKFNPDERFQTYSINGRHVRILNIRSQIG
ncbi:MAG: hypothetical protein AB7F86_18510, partial [Bdellovibrionales bacterium]